MMIIQLNKFYLQTIYVYDTYISAIGISCYVFSQKHKSKKHDQNNPNDW